MRPALLRAFFGEVSDVKVNSLQAWNTDPSNGRPVERRGSNASNHPAFPLEFYPLPCSFNVRHRFSVSVEELPSTLQYGCQDSIRYDSLAFQSEST